MFSFFKKKTSVPIKDHVWMSVAEKYMGLLEQVQRLVLQGKPVFIFSYFEQSLEEVQKVLGAAEVAYQTNLSPVSEHALVFLLPAPEVDLSALSSLTKRLGAKEFHFLFVEHYPALQKEEQFLEEVRALIPGASFLFYEAVEGAFLHYFAGERLAGLMQTLGIEENEMIQHTMVSKSIRRAQEKIQKKVITEMPARSQKEWVEKNLA